MEVIGGGVVTPLSAVRPCGKGLPPRGPWTVWMSTPNHWLPT
jgi:hypothetical protein